MADIADNGSEKNFGELKEENERMKNEILELSKKIERIISKVKEKEANDANAQLNLRSRLNSEEHREDEFAAENKLL